MSGPDHKTYTIAGLHKAFKQLPKVASAQLRDASALIAGHVADDAKRRAMQTSRTGALVAPTIRAGRDRVPVVKMGSTKKLPPRNGKARTGKRQSIGDIIWGAEFGALAHKQFMPWTGRDSNAGYFLYPAVRAHADDTGREYSAALDAALDMV